MSGGVITTISTGAMSPPSLTSTRCSPTPAQESIMSSLNSSSISSAAAYIAGAAVSVTPSKPPRAIQKPRPLRLGGLGSGRPPAWEKASATGQLFCDSMPIGELLTLMEHVNRAVKSGHFTVLLANQIHRLYNQLKYCGEMLETSNKGELNRVFVSLRQACCRDAGQLGTACRVRIMELIELRAMGWVPNLAHSQYYSKRSSSSVLSRECTVAAGDSSCSTGAMAPRAEVDSLPALPESAPPFGAVPLGSFAFNIPPTPLPSADYVQSTHAFGAQPSYYLIPASHVSHTQAGIAFISPAAAAVISQPPPPPLKTVSGATTPSSAPQPMKPASQAKLSSKSFRSPRTAGKNQHRGEMTIRNADSGKSRRVAIIEELSQTVISFQKVAVGAKDRSLIINGPSEEHIAKAKALIEETIRRNVSPVRPDDIKRDAVSTVPSTFLEGLISGNETFRSIRGRSTSEAEMSILTGESGGILKLSSADPQLLQVAKLALNRYFHQDAKSSSGKENTTREMMKTRRKSLSALTDVLTDVSLNSSAGQQNVSEALSSNSDASSILNLGCKSHIKLSARSTPNLATGFVEESGSEEEVCREEKGRHLLQPNGSYQKTEFAESTSIHSEKYGSLFQEEKDRIMVRVVYPRELFLQFSGSPLSRPTPPNLQWISRDLSDVLRAIPGKFDLVKYKELCHRLHGATDPPSKSAC